MSFVFGLLLLRAQRLLLTLDNHMLDPKAGLDRSERIMPRQNKLPRLAICLWRLLQTQGGFIFQTNLVLRPSKVIAIATSSFLTQGVWQRVLQGFGMPRATSGGREDAQLEAEIGDPMSMSAFLMGRAPNMQALFCCNYSGSETR